MGPISRGTAKELTGIVFGLPRKRKPTTFCKVCGKEIERTYKERRYCSRKCANVERRARL